TRWRRFGSWSSRSSLELSQSRRRELQVAPRGLLGLLLERMQHVNGVGKGSDVDHPVCSRRVADSDFPNARADRRHRLPVAGVATRLDEVELVASIPARLFGEASQAIERVSVKRHPLERHGVGLYLYRYKKQVHPACSGPSGDGG